MGFNTKQGAEGVGKSTTAAVVSSSVVILLLDTCSPGCCSTNDRAQGREEAVRRRRWCSTAWTSTVQDGETVALLGPSGTGKSVLLKHIIGLIRPDAGRSSWTART